VHRHVAIAGVNRFFYRRKVGVTGTGDVGHSRQSHPSVDKVINIVG
jgi:hypothetical protein